MTTPFIIHHERSSNIELLRCVLMFLIVVSHFVAHNILDRNLENPISFSDMNYISSNLLLSASIGAVNCFVIISGYFTIKLSLKKLTLFILPVIFYELILGALFFKVKPQSYMLINYWFVRYYLALMLLSPILNYGLEKLKKQDFQLILLLIFVFFILPISSITGNRGMNIFIFILMYMIGFYIKHHFTLRCSWEGCFFLYLLSIALIMLETLAFHKTGKNYGAGTYSYNRDSIFVIASSVSLFLTFLKLNFKSKFVNWIAGSCFFVYIISENVNLWKSPYSMYDFFYVEEWSNSTFYPMYILGASLLVFILCIMLDKIRNRIFNKVENKAGILADRLQTKYFSPTGI